jgi:hypothetical protein
MTIGGAMSETRFLVPSRAATTSAAERTGCETAQENGLRRPALSMRGTAVGLGRRHTRGRGSDGLHGRPEGSLEAVPRIESAGRPERNRSGAPRDGETPQLGAASTVHARTRPSQSRTVWNLARPARRSSATLMRRPRFPGSGRRSEGLRQRVLARPAPRTLTRHHDAADEQLPTPDAPRLPALQRPGQARLLDRAVAAQGLGGLHVGRRLGEEQLGVDRRQGRTSPTSPRIGTVISPPPAKVISGHLSRM